MKSTPLALTLLLAAATAGAAPDPSFEEVARRVGAMPGDAEAQRLAAKHGLNVLNVTWEDAGRFKGSAVGPNISDMTIQVHVKDQQDRVRPACMPVIRFPNFSDRTGDVPLDSFYVLVGNERGSGLRPVTLRELLGNLRRYLNAPLSWKGTRTSLLAERDSHALVSAQACFLPVPKGGKATFNPVLFNYQSAPGDPAVLTILASREGTSVTIIDNQRDAFGTPGGAWGQRLFFNANGQRASFTGERQSDVMERGGPDTAPNAPAHGATGPLAKGDSHLNMVLLIQVPLKIKRPPARMEQSMCEDGAPAPCAAPGEKRQRSDVEAAVIGHGALEGPFTEIDGVEIERDARFPVRVTVQFYKATSNGVVASEDMAQIAEQIETVYTKAEAVGSLVTSGETGRVTEHAGPKVQPPNWWATFWADYEARNRESAAQARKKLERDFGKDWTPKNRDELEKALKLPLAVGEGPAHQLLKADGPWSSILLGLLLVFGVSAARHWSPGTE